MSKKLNIRAKKNITNAIIIFFIAAGLAWIASLFIHIGGEYTNNAQVRQEIIPVLSRVQGFIKSVNFEDFQSVRKGDVLATIEDSEFRLRLAQAYADCHEVEIQLENAEADYIRYKNLLKQEAVTQQQFDAVETQYKTLKARLQEQQKGESPSEENKLGVCKAALDLAKLNLSYTIITAPCDGIASRKVIHAGELVMPGKQLVSVVDSSKKWIVANYRETQMKHIRPGDKAKITVDAFPGISFNGEVESISSATGAQFAVVSSDNSVGNFVKVEQRIPVKIIFTQDNDPEMIKRLASGMNAECVITEE